MLTFKQALTNYVDVVRNATASVLHDGISIIPEEISVIKNDWYYKIVRTNHDGTKVKAHSFISRDTGEIFKADSWTTPGIDICGSIFDIKNLHTIVEYAGPVYRRKSPSTMNKDLYIYG